MRPERQRDLSFVQFRPHIQTTGNLTERMNAAISSSGERNWCLSSKQRCDRCFQVALYRSFARLTLRAGELPSIVRDHQLQTMLKLAIGKRLNQLN